MFFRLCMAAGLIAATVVIQALFMTVGLNKFKRIEERRPGAMAACYYDSDMDPLSANSDYSRRHTMGDVLLRGRRITKL
jgi:hypothetical protein